MTYLRVGRYSKDSTDRGKMRRLTGQPDGRIKSKDGQNMIMKGLERLSCVLTSRNKTKDEGECWQGSLGVKRPKS